MLFSMRGISRTEMSTVVRMLSRGDSSATFLPCGWTASACASATSGNGAIAVGASGLRRSSSTSRPRPTTAPRRALSATPNAATWVRSRCSVRTRRGPPPAVSEMTCTAAVSAGPGGLATT